MNKTELVEAIASSTELTKTDVDKVVTALVDVVTDALAKGDKVSLKGFGNFEVRTRSERTGRNPRTGETMTIAASKAPAFKASSALKKAVKDGDMENGSIMAGQISGLVRKKQSARDIIEEIFFEYEKIKGNF